MENPIYQIFSDLENKLNIYTKLSSLITCENSNYLSQLSRAINFDIIDTHIFKYENKEILSHLYFLKEKIEKLLFNETLIEKIASHDKIGLEFSTINTIKSEIRTEINSYLQKINEYIDYIKKRLIFINQEMDTDDLINTHEEKLFEFKANIVVDLLSLELNRIILFDKIKFDETKNSINKFIAGEFDSINPTLNLNVSDKNHAYYLIHSLQNHSVFDLKDIKNITINGEGFVANHCSKAITEINKKKRTNNKKSKEFFLVKDEIDSLIKANLIEIR